MSCDRWLPLLLLSADNRGDELSETERSDLETHLAGCAGCRESLEEQREVAELLRCRDDAPPPVGFAIRVTSQLNASTQWVDLLRWRIWTYRLVPVTAILLLVAVLVTPGRSGSTGETVVPELAEAWAFGTEGSDSLPAFALLGQEDVGGDVLLDVILSSEADDLLTMGDPS